MPFIEVKHIGRCSAEQKRALVRELTEAYARALGKDPGRVWVTLQEFDAQDWATGGQLVSERDDSSE
ncbi:4-oxalocrotonate tautomerase family protein [Streptomyces sp. ISL-100]|uniref:tautomerase family protein n=1 Tax=Streptomyces sp. ISL-100 TaxID=2819173 RepID=UPI001BE59003|nr:4-oxalocrotonate tautomerase family protein [Streptomyces sp. ISL-100]MBT2396931.1 4-oxalocrotonate tautomerase family protein [Streptomyces sp. ISL-100]